MMQQYKIEINGDIDEEKTADILKSIDAAQGMPIRLIIDSSMGGDVNMGLQIYDALKNHPEPVSAHIISACCGISAIIFLAARFRTMEFDAVLMLTRTRVKAWNCTLKDLQKLAAMVEQVDKRIESILKPWPEYFSFDPQVINPKIANQKGLIL